MAHMSCYCGASMSNVMCPSENIIYVVAKKNVDSALKYNSELILSDFITNWDSLTDKKRLFISEQYDYWYCPECKRIYKCEAKINGRKLAVFKPVNDYISIESEHLTEMEELIVFTDFEEDNATEQNPCILVKDFVDSISDMRYFLSKDHEYVYAFDCITQKISFVYKSEKLKTDKS